MFCDESLYAREWQCPWILSDSHLRHKGPSPKDCYGPSVWLTLRQVRENVRRLNKCFFLIICILFTTPYNQNIHKEGQRHIIVHTDLTTEMWTDLSHSCNRFCSTSDTSKSCLIFTCVIWVFLLLSMDSRRKNNIISGQGSLFTI